MPIKLISPNGGHDFSVQPPTTATSTARTVTLPDATTTLVGTDATQTLTNKTIQGGALTLATAQASTSGTSIDFTGIPSWVKRITVMFNAVSIAAGSDLILVQLGDSGGVENTGYSSAAAYIVSTPSYAAISTGAGFPIYNTGPNLPWHGSVVLSLLDASANRWCASGVLNRGDVTLAQITAGSKALSATLDRVRITTSGGTNTFNAGTINIMYEG